MGMNTIPSSSAQGEDPIELSPPYSRIDFAQCAPPPIGTPPQYRQPIHPPSFRMNIVIHVVGSRGDVQPFVALGNALQRDGHRVRLATHDVFVSFVRESGLEFYPIGGNPAELMAYMVNSSNLIPDLATIQEGAIQRKRSMYRHMLTGFWDSCTEPDSETGSPFVADAIIANPPSFAHVHCAEALGILVHLVFTMPWSQTSAFPHPLSGMKSKGKGTGRTNYASYAAVDFLTWQGLGDLVNHWRVHTLDLEAVPGTEAPGLLKGLHIPFTYCWSPSLVPKPADWGSNIDVTGFIFREPAPYTPPDDLAKFLNVGTPPVYIGFGSIVVGDPDGLMAMVLSAVNAAGVRAIVSKGWSKLSGEPSPDIFYIDDCPHEWLFQHVSAVIHHGGAGTTACGLKYGRPTAIVPFFGDQFFWGTVVSEANAGPPPLPYESLTSQKLADAIGTCLSSETKEAALDISHRISCEDGVNAAVESFYKHLPQKNMTCDFFPGQTAVWAYGHGQKTIGMCQAVATILRNRDKVSRKEIRLHRSGNVKIEPHRWEPFTAVSSASFSTVVGAADGVADIIRKPVKVYKQGHPKQKQIADPTQEQSDNDQMVIIAHAAVPSSAAILPQPGEIIHLNEATGLGNEQHESRTTAATMALASAKGISKALTRTACGILVDIPVAATEGLRAVPELWGETTTPHAHVRDWRSGLEVGCTSFYQGINSATTSIFVRTYNAKRLEGSAGVAKGLSQGTIGFITKTTAAVTGLLAYPAQGVSRSMRAAVKSHARQRIMEARWKMGDWLVQNDPSWENNHAVILEDFEGLRGRKGRGR
ncbi:glycosyltransferase family 1 protein [Hypoxylon sp. CI-4A]|nr:glycosyltransferase family 1 protein [Hypoxylon sp. CI-4A]